MLRCGFMDTQEKAHGGGKPGMCEHTFQLVYLFVEAILTSSSCS